MIAEVIAVISLISRKTIIKLIVIVSFTFNGKKAHAVKACTE